MTFWHGFGRMIPRSLDRGSLLNNQRRAQIHLLRFSARASKSALQTLQCRGFRLLGLFDAD